MPTVDFGCNLKPNIDAFVFWVFGTLYFIRNSGDNIWKNCLLGGYGKEN